MSLTTSRSRPLARSFSRASSPPRRCQACSAAKPTSVWPARRRPARLLQHVLGGLEHGSSRRSRPAFLSLSEAGWAGLEVGDRRGHQEHVAVLELLLAGLGQVGRRASPPATRGSCGWCKETLAATTVTLAPRAAVAPSARARPIRPEELFAMKRTLSIGSRVPPALTSTRSPRQLSPSGAAPRWSCAVGRSGLAAQRERHSRPGRPCGSPRSMARAPA